MEKTFKIPPYNEVCEKIFVLTNLHNIKKLYPEFYEYLNLNYPIDIKFVEKMYWYYNDISSYPLCECGNRVKFNSFIKGYHKFCSYKCSRNSEYTKQKLIQTNLKRYGCKFNSQANGPKEKMKLTNLKRYGCSCSLHNDEISNKVRKKKMERYGDPTFTNTDKMKITKLQRYGNPTFTNPTKGYNTRKLNKSYNSSSIEKNLQKWLVDHNIEFEYQYKSDKYPFYCDFYFPKSDLYLEIQGNWTHGFHPYDETNKDDIKRVELWKNKSTKYYNTALQVWTITDPIKRQTAKDNNLNWVETFSINLQEILKILKENNII